MQTPPRPSDNASLRFCFVFVCQSGELEIKALLLAASLRRYIRSSYELVAAVPGPASAWGELSATTIALLKKLGVRIETIVNPIGDDYPIGNKLACLSVPTTARQIVFLDSDILCLRDLPDDVRLATAFAAKPADLRTFSASADAWRPLYAAAKTEMPSVSLPTSVSGAFGLPYFNSGVVFADTAANLGATWIQCARDLDAFSGMQPHGHWLDQVSLAIAVRKLDLSYTALDENFNFPAHLKPLRSGTPVFCHYHWPRVVRAEATLRKLGAELAAEYPEIAELSSQTAGWSGLSLSPPAKSFRRVWPRTRARTNDIVIAGIPNSGDDLVCDTLSRFSHCAVVRSASHIPARDAWPPWDAAVYVRDVRRDIVAGENVEGLLAPSPRNVFRDGDDFVLAINNPLSFLCGLNALRRVLPDARFVACIDNPFETIARWKLDRPALRDVYLSGLGLADASWLTHADSERLKLLAASTDVSERRAMLWWWLAQRLLDQSNGVVVIKRGALIEDPEQSMRRILKGMSPGKLVRQRMKNRDSSPTLEERDREAIRAICSQPAADLGV